MQTSGVSRRENADVYLLFEIPIELPPRHCELGPLAGSMRWFVFGLRRRLLMLDRQRAIMCCHFPVVLSRDRIGSRFSPLFEHSSTFNQISGAGHWIPLSATPPSYVGWPFVFRPTGAVQIGVLNRRLPGPSGHRRQPKPAHLREARPAMLSVNQADQRPHDRTPLLAHLRPIYGVPISGGFLQPGKMASSAPPDVSRSGPDEAASRSRDRRDGAGVNSRAAIRSAHLTIFWRCDLAPFSSRTTPERGSGNEPSTVLAEDSVSQGSGNADSQRKGWSSGWSGARRPYPRDSGTAHPASWRASASYRPLRAVWAVCAWALRGCARSPDPSARQHSAPPKGISR